MSPPPATGQEPTRTSRAGWDRRPALLALVVSVPLLALTWRLEHQQPGKRLTTARPRAEDAAEVFVESWAAGDQQQQRQVAAAAVVEATLQDPRYRWPPNTPATDGARLRLEGSDEGANETRLSGSMAWGAAERTLLLTLRRGPDGYRVTAMHWQSLNERP